jgi:hypothetical protein
MYGFTKAQVTMVVLMPVVPELGFVEQKEEDQPNQQGQEQIVRTGLALKGLGQQVHKGRGQQRPSRQTEHVLGVARQNTKAQQGCKPHAADSC